MESTRNSRVNERKRKTLNFLKNSALLSDLQNQNKINENSLQKIALKLSSSDSNLPGSKKLIHTINQYSSLHKEILENLKGPTSFGIILKKLKQFKKLKSSENIIFYYHIKGHSTAHGITLTPEETIEKTKFNVSHFSNLFNHIHKSKNKIFNNSTDNYDIVPVIGTYLADSFKASFYDFVLIISRNDFLPPTSDEIDDLHELISSLRPFFSNILAKENAESRFEIMNKMLTHSSLPFMLMKDDKEIFRSENFTSLDNYKVIDLQNSSLELCYQGSDNNSHDSEIFHFQRVAILGELLNTLQHELSNPLFGIRLSSEILMLEEQDSETKEFLEQIFDSSMRCQNIIKDFSTLYTIEDSKEWFVLSRTIRESLTLSKSATQNIEKNFIFDTELESLEIYSNPRWLNHIVFNAIINSAQALNSLENKKKKTIDIILEKNLTDICIKIVDDGPGIDQANENKLFSAFFTTKNDGTGLGLSICKNLADKLNAEIFLKNNKDEGCTFTIILKNEKDLTR